jgi:hypothetical protein
MKSQHARKPSTVRIELERERKKDIEAARSIQKPAAIMASPPSGVHSLNSGVKANSFQFPASHMAGVAVLGQSISLSKSSDFKVDRDFKAIS